MQGSASLGLEAARGQAQVLAGCNALEDATELWELTAWNQADSAPAVAVGTGAGAAIGRGKGTGQEEDWSDP